MKTFKTLNEALAERGELEDEMEKLATRAESSRLTPAEKSKFDEIKNDLEEIDQQIVKLTIQEKRQKAKASEKFNKLNRDDDDNNPAFSFEIKKAAAPTSGPITDWVSRNYNVTEDEAKCDIGKVLMALSSSRPTDRTTEKVLGTFKSVSGAATLTEYLSAKLWEAGIAKSHLAQAGMQTFLMEEPTVRFPKIIEYPALEWKAEAASTTERSITISSVDGVARTLRGFVQISGELMQDGHGVFAAVRRAFAKSTANSIDTGGLLGDNIAPNPRGLVSYTNINTLNLSGTLDDYDPFLNAGKLILEDDGEFPDTSIMSPAVWTAMQLIKTATEEMPMPRPSALANHRFFETTKITDQIFMGGFRSLHLGIRLDTQIITTPITADTFENNILCVSRANFFPEREQDFAIIDNVELT